MGNIPKDAALLLLSPGIGRPRVETMRKTRQTKDSKGRYMLNRSVRQDKTAGMRLPFGLIRETSALGILGSEMSKVKGITLHKDCNIGD